MRCCHGIEVACVQHLLEGAVLRDTVQANVLGQFMVAPLCVLGCLEATGPPVDLIRRHPKVVLEKGPLP